VSLNESHKAKEMQRLCDTPIQKFLNDHTRKNICNYYVTLPHTQVFKQNKTCISILFKQNDMHAHFKTLKHVLVVDTKLGPSATVTIGADSSAFL
jgi:hypothetical protein